MQDEGSRPYRRTAMYRGFMESRWDVVVIMLGTNDARDEASMLLCNSLVHAFLDYPCAPPKSSWDGLSWWPGKSEKAYAADAEALVRDALSRGPADGVPPKVFLMSPPPLVIDGTSGASRAIINELEPSLLAPLSKDLLGRELIDLSGPFGGPGLDCSADLARLATVVAPDAPPDPSAPCSLWQGCHGERPEASTCDFLHPNHQGYHVIARTVYDAITSSALWSAQSLRNL